MLTKAVEEMLFRIAEKIDTIETKLDLLQRKNDLGAKPFLSIKELSDYASIPLSTAYQMSSQNVLPKYRVGKRVLFKKSEIESLIESHRIATDAEIEARVQADLMLGRD